MTTAFRPRMADDACVLCGYWTCRCPQQVYRDEITARLGIDADLVAGPIGGDATEADELARLHALVDMVDAGFITSDELDLVASLVDDIEAEDDAAGFEDEPEARGWGWAA